MAEENKAPETTPAAAAGQAPAPEAKPQEKTRLEKPKNCCVCNKVVAKIRWYYRNGKFYCNKRCWMAAKKKAEEEIKKVEAEKAEAEAKAAEEAKAKVEAEAKAKAEEAAKAAEAEKAAEASKAEEPAKPAETPAADVPKPPEQQ